MESKTSICNLALSHLAIGKGITNIETDRNEEALASKSFYDIALQKVLRDGSWYFATRFIALSLIETNPNDEWSYSYRYPNNCLRLMRILSGTRNDTRQSAVPYKISSDNNGRIILTDKQNAEIEYIHEITDIRSFPPDFIIALSYLLAFYISPRITGGDKFGLGERAFKLYEYEINKAIANEKNEQQDEEEPQSEFIRARE
jgi:hypothetical protein